LRRSVPLGRAESASCRGTRREIAAVSPGVGWIGTGRIGARWIRIQSRQCCLESSRTGLSGYLGKSPPPEGHWPGNHVTE